MVASVPVKGYVTSLPIQLSTNLNIGTGVKKKFVNYLFSFNLFGIGTCFIDLCGLLRVSGCMDFLLNVDYQLCRYGADQ